MLEPGKIEHQQEQMTDRIKRLQYTEPEKREKFAHILKEEQDQEKKKKRKQDRLEMSDEQKELQAANNEIGEKDDSESLSPDESSENIIVSENSSSESPHIDLKA